MCYGTYLNYSRNPKLSIANSILYLVVSGRVVEIERWPANDKDFQYINTVSSSRKKKQKQKIHIVNMKQ